MDWVWDVFFLPWEASPGGCPDLCFFPRCGQVTFDIFHVLGSFMINGLFEK